MSAESRVASRYAKSIITLAQEQGKLDTVKDDIVSFKETCDESRGLRLLLKNPIIKQSKKLGIINTLFEGKVDSLLLSFFQLVCRKGRESLLYIVAEEIIKEYNLIKGIQKATVKTPFALTSDLKNEFESIVKGATGKEVELVEEVDADLIGGFVLSVGDKQIDESLQAKLRRLRNQFMN